MTINFCTVYMVNWDTYCKVDSTGKDSKNVNYTHTHTHTHT
jgi:hypothetical protein